MNDLIIRDAEEQDTARLLEIYAPYVTETAVSFEYESPSVEEFHARMETVQREYPYLVAEKDGLIIGYAYASPFHFRIGYRTKGTYQNCGYKFGRWYSVIWMEKQLAPKPDVPDEFIPYPMIRQCEGE